MGADKIAVFGVPSAAGTRAPGVEHGPFALREAGLLEALRQAGRPVVNLSDLSLFPYREDDLHPRERNVEGTACALRATADEMTRALAEGFALVLGGDCTLAAGAVAGARRALGVPVGLLFLDANADLNTAATTPSGFLDGMALALALGRGPQALTEVAPAPVDPEHAVLLGFRDLDPGERPALGELGLALPADAVRKLGPRVAAALSLDAAANDDGPLVVHLDVDVVDPAEMPAKNLATPGTGLSLAETGDLLLALVASPRVVALEVAGYDPSRDEGGRSARVLVDLLGRLWARKVKAAS